MANNKVSPITLQSNDVATLGSQGNSIIAHNNGLTSIRAAGNNESAAVDPFNDDCSGIYASPGGISLNTKATQTNYQTIGSTQTQQNNPNNIVQANIPIPSVSVTLPIQAPKPSLLPSPTPTPTPSVESEFIDMVFLPEREDSPVVILDVDLGVSSEKILTGKDEKNISSTPPNNVNYNNIIVKTTGVSPNDFLSKDNNGSILPFYNFIAAAKASIGTFTKNIPDTKNGTLGCGAGVSLIYLRATGHGMRYDLTKSSPKPGEKVNLVLGTASIYDYMRKDTKNWKQRANWKDAQPGDCLVTVTLKQGYNGHIGWVVDTKINDGKTFDVVSNSSTGYTGTKSDKALAGSIQNNYSVKKWESIANRKGVGPTYAYEFIGNFNDPNRTI